MCTVKQHPGKFEGESCITHLMHDWSMGGTLDYEDCDCENVDDDLYFECRCPPVYVAVGPFTLDDIRQFQVNAPHGEDSFCAECEIDFLAASTIRYWEDFLGFVYSEIV